MIKKEAIPLIRFSSISGTFIGLVVLLFGLWVIRNPDYITFLFKFDQRVGILCVIFGFVFGVSRILLLFFWKPAWYVSIIMLIILLSPAVIFICILFLLSMRGFEPFESFVITVMFGIFYSPVSLFAIFELIYLSKPEIRLLFD
ncbi:MAG: hypothetical protein AAB929_03570 [Patescibacteria group bacterium]